MKELVIRWKEEMRTKRGREEERGRGERERILRKDIYYSFSDFLLLVADM